MWGRWLLKPLTVRVMTVNLERRDVHHCCRMVVAVLELIVLFVSACSDACGLEWGKACPCIKERAAVGAVEHISEGVISQELLAGSHLIFHF